MPDLVELEVVRGYRSSQRTLTHPRARVMTASRGPRRTRWDQLWRALDGYACVRVPGARGLALPLAVLHEAVESCAIHAIGRSGWPALRTALRERERGGGTTVTWRHT